MKQRPILVAVIGYMIGILWGLYFKFSIVLCYILILATYSSLKKFLKFNQKHEFKLLSFRRYHKYLKLILDSKVIFILIIFSFISNQIILFQNKKQDNLYQDGEQVETIGIVVNQKIEKQYYDLYQIKSLNKKHVKLYIQVSKKSEELKYGDKVKLEGEYRKPSEQRNYGGYNDKQYLKTLKIDGRVKVNQIEVIAEKQQNMILQTANAVNLKIKEKIETNFNEQKSAILKGLLLGETEDIKEEQREKFQISNISHILAVSGMHIGYVIIGIQLLLEKKIGKKKTKIITIIILIGYSFITGFSPSIVRAVVMAVITISSGIIYRKSDIWNSIAISLFGILIYNPFLICQVGLQLSFLGTIGIIVLKENIFQFLNEKINIKNKRKEMIAVMLSAQIMILPILLFHFNIIGIYFLGTNLLVSIIIGPIMMITFFCILAFFVFDPIAKLFAIPLKIGLHFLNLISKTSELPFSKIYVPTPSLISIILYYTIICIGNKIYSIYHINQSTATQQRIKNLISLFRYKVYQNKKKYVIYFILIILIFFSIRFIPQDLKIYFVDVGQGDCTFIVTPQDKTILIDGGGGVKGDYDVGKKTVIPYLLDRGYIKIDYMFISHFDNDHVEGLLTVLKELKVKNVILGKQFESSENYKQFLQIVKEKKIKVKVVESGCQINIENNLYFDIIWPKSDNVVSKNSINNNALVCKLNYKNFSMLFTGDIEEETEKILVSQYKKTNHLKATVLKIAHHGSKTSSTEEFLEFVNSRIALIGVGKNNTFGHPNDDILKRLQNFGMKIFRTDEKGEIRIEVNNKGKIKINTLIE